MNVPPPHVQVFRVALVALVVLLLLVAAALVPWHDVVLVLDPAVDGIRRRIWS